MYSDLNGANSTEIISCKYGWTYENSIYENTIVTEVSFVLHTALRNKIQILVGSSV